MMASAQTESNTFLAARDPKKLLEGLNNLQEN